MGKVTITETTYQNYGKCLEISNGTVQLLVTTDIGPRIIRYAFVGGENMLFEDTARSRKETGPAFDKFGGGTWYIYGGHRLWTSPEGMPKSYYPDNEPVHVEIIENGAVFTPPVQKWNQYQLSISVTMCPDTGSVTLGHTVTNHAAWPVELAPWALTVLAPGGTEIVPMPTRDTGLLSNRLLALWPYAKMNDPRVTWGDKYITLRQQPGATQNFKLGLNSEHGYAMYFNHGDVFIKRFTPVLDGNYPDGGMSFETFTDGSFLEMETLGETTVIAPGDTAVHEERWMLAKEDAPAMDEAAYDALAAKYVK